jgi:hypothetical protein
MATLARLADIDVRGSEAQRIRPPDGAQTWSPSSVQATLRARQAEDAGVGRQNPAPAGGYPKPRQRYGYPGQAKGAIYALDPNDGSRGDVLYFSRFPETLDEEIEAVLASDSGPGRAFPAFQQMGAKGVKLSTELWFCDAFLWRGGWASVGPRERAARAQVAARGGVAPASLDMRPTATLAEQARIFFEFYIAGHDGTGLALPPADLYLHCGDRELPIPIVIERVKMRQEHFTSNGTRSGYPGGVPQTVTVQLDMQVNIPLRTVDLFKPKRPDPPKPKPPRRQVCPTGPGQLIDGLRVVEALAVLNPTAAALGLIAPPERVQDKTGFPPPPGN